jgi:hypothetical protein
MFAVLAIIALALALVFHLAGGSVAQYVEDAWLAGLICVAVHLAWPGFWPGRGRRTP